MVDNVKRQVRSYPRCLVTTGTTGATTPYTLSAQAMPGHLTPAQLGANDGELVTFWCGNALSTVATIWEIGWGILTNTGGVWTLSRNILRNQDGANSAVNWTTGPKYLWITVHPDFQALLDARGYLGVGGVKGRALDAPLDVVGLSDTGYIARFADTAGAYKVSIKADATYFAQGVNVTGDGSFTGNVSMAGNLTTSGDLKVYRAAATTTGYAFFGTGGAYFGFDATRFVTTHGLAIASGGLNVTGSSVISGGLTVSTGGLSVSASGASITGGITAVTGNIVASAGDLQSARAGAPTEGLIFLGNSGARYLHYNAGGYNFVLAPVNCGTSLSVGTSASITTSLSVGTDAAITGALNVGKSLSANATDGTYQFRANGSYSDGAGNYVCNGVYYGSGGQSAYTRFVHQVGVQIYMQHLVGGGTYSFYDSGTATCNGVWADGSDGRVKVDREPIADPDAILDKVDGFTYRRTDLLDTVTRHAGVEAQALRAAGLPEAVIEGPKPPKGHRGEGFLSVNYNALTAVLVESGKRRRRETRALRDELDEVKQQLRDLRGVVEQMQAKMG